MLRRRSAWKASTRTRLLLLVAALLLPCAAFSAFVFRDFAQIERAHYPTEALTLAQTLSLTVDQELVGLIAAAETLALSPGLLDDPADLGRRAGAILAERGRSIEIRDPDGTLRLAVPNANPPLDDPERRATDQRVLQGDAHAISNLLHDPGGNPLVAVAVPIRESGRVAHILSLSLDPLRLARILERAAPPGWTVSVVDRADRILARSQQNDRYLGQLTTADLRREATGQSGTWTGTTLAGGNVLGAYVRSPVSGWRIAVGVPLEAIDAPLARLTGLIAAAGLAVVLAALVVALLIARTITRPVAALTTQAERLARGEPATPLATGLPEADEVGAALARAGTAIEQRGADLRRSEARFRAAVAAVQGVMWTNDATGRMTGQQPGWSALTGQTEAEYQGHGWSQAVHPDDAPATLAAWRQAVSERKPFIFQHRVRRRDGAWRRFSIRAIPNLDEHGHPLEWVGVHTDVTDEVQAKRLLASQEAQLRDLNATLEQRVAETSAERDRIWRISSELMLIAGLDGRVVNVNPAWTTHLAWSEPELRGLELDALLHPEDRAATRRELARLAGGRAVLRFENRCRHRDGTYRWIAWTAVPDADLIHAIGREITAEKEAAEALRRTEDQLRQSQKMEVVGQLTGGIAHDFNNLLTVVTGHLEMGLRRVAKPEAAGRLERHLNAALEGARRAAVLTHRLLAFSRQSSLRPEILDLNAAIGSMHEMIVRALGETVAVETRLDPDLPPVTADLNQVENAVLNLCVNARDAMPRGGRLRLETRSVEFDADAPPVARGELAPGAYAELAVADDGEGIPPEIQDRVFEPFFTTKPVGKGTGLGLSQVFGFMRQSGGLATLESTLGAGTTIRLLFPRAAPPDPVVATPTPAPATAAADPSGRTILVVEDEESVRDFSVAALEEAGYRVIAAPDAAAGLACLADPAPIDLLFVDIVLGSLMNGRELADIARRQRPALPILFTTGYTGGSLPAPAELGPRAGLVTKPFDTATLLARVTDLLGAPPSPPRTAH